MKRMRKFLFPLGVLLSFAIPLSLPAFGVISCFGWLILSCYIPEMQKKRFDWPIQVACLAAAGVAMACAVSGKPLYDGILMLLRILAVWVLYFSLCASWRKKSLLRTVLLIYTGCCILQAGLFLLAADIGGDMVHITLEDLDLYYRWIKIANSVDIIRCIAGFLAVGILVRENRCKT